MLAILLFCFLTRLAVPCALGWAAMVTLSARPEDAGALAGRTASCIRVEGLKP